MADQRVISLKKHLKTGVQYVLPLAAAGGILAFLARLFGGPEIAMMGPEGGFAGLDPLNWIHILWALEQLSLLALRCTFAVFAAGIVYSMAGTEGIIPGLLCGILCREAAAGVILTAGMALLCGVIVRWAKEWQFPYSLKACGTPVIIPLVSAFLTWAVFSLLVVGPANWLSSFIAVRLAGLYEHQPYVFGAVSGALSAVDFGGPLYSAAVQACGLVEDAAKGAAALGASMPVPSLGAFIAVLISSRKFTGDEKAAGAAGLATGLCGLREGALVMAVNDPLRFIPCAMAGCGVSAALSLVLPVSASGYEGGLFLIPQVSGWPWFLLAVFAGALVCGLAYAMVKIPQDPALIKEAEIIEIEI